MTRFFQVTKSGMKNFFGPRILNLGLTFVDYAVADSDGLTIIDIKLGAEKI